MNAANQIEGITGGWVSPEYDAAGNMIYAPKSGEETTGLHFVRDAWNRQVAVYEDDGDGVFEPTSGDTLLAKYEFDGANRRIEKTFADDTGVEYFYNQSWQLLEEVSVDDEVAPTAVNQYVWSPRYIDAPVARFHDATPTATCSMPPTTFATTPAMPTTTSPLRSTPPPATSSSVTSTAPTAKRRSTIRRAQPISGARTTDGPLYCGYFFDAETGNYRVRYREYITCLSTFDITDPAGYKGGINLYAYVGNSPLMLTDPTGLAGCGYLVCVRSEGSHSWIYAKNLDDGTEHTYGRWNAGYGGCNSKGVHMDVELKAGRKHTCERCIIVSTFTPTFNFGYDWYNKNCSTYAHDSWQELTGEYLESEAWWGGDHPDALCQSITNMNGGSAL